MSFIQSAKNAFLSKTSALKKALEIVRFGHPALEVKTEHISQQQFGPHLKQLADDMVYTLERKFKGEYSGLAATQVDRYERLFVYKVDSLKIPLQVMVNPYYQPLNEEKEYDWEGCFSLPGLIGKVPRYKTVNVQYQTLEGKEENLQAKGFHARILQHEIDHLDGIVFTQRMDKFDGNHFGFEKEIMAKMKKKRLSEKKDLKEKLEKEKKTQSV